MVGGGLVGATLAIALGESGLDVALVEARAPAPEPPDGFDYRVSAVTRATERILRALRVWDRLDPSRIGAFREMHVWDARSVGEIHFDSAEIAEPSLGYVVENQRLQIALESRLGELESVTWYRPMSIVRLDVETGHVAVTLDRAEVQSALVAGADGADSKVRELAGIACERGEYGQRALVCTVRTEQPHRETAWQRFLPTGPLAFLPLPRNHCSIVWSTVPEHAAALVDMPGARFERALEEAFQSRLGRVELVGERASFPLRHLHAERYVESRVALLGDAAHTIHPLAGQGVNLGFSDAAVLAEVIGEARGRGRDFAARSVLRRYERWRRGHNVLMQGTMDGFYWLFGSKLPAVRTLRNLGLGAANQLEPVKRAIMRHASGLAGDLPALARAPRLE